MSKLRRDERARLVRMYESSNRESTECPSCIGLSMCSFDEPRDRLRERGLIRLARIDTIIDAHGAFKRNVYAVTSKGMQTVKLWLRLRHTQSKFQWLRNVQL